MAWADLQLKNWTAGEKLTAAALNTEFAKIKTALDSTVISAEGGGQTLTEAGSTTVLALNNKDIDTNNELNVATNAFSPKAEGYYAVTCGAYINSANADTNRTLAIYVNGQASKKPSVVYSPSRLGFQVAHVFKAKPGDVFDCRGATGAASEVWIGTMTVCRVR
jgi:hypothetical protein